MDPSALNGNEIRQGRPLHQCNADCGPQLELRQGLQLSVQQSIAAGKITKWGQKSSRLVLPRTALPRTSSNPGQNLNPSSNSDKKCKLQQESW